MNKFYTVSAAALAILAGFAAPAQAKPETYAFDPFHTNVFWQANHFGFSNPSGKFGTVTGSLVLDEEKPADSKVDVTINTGSVETGIPLFNEHLKNDKFFNSEKFPTATFQSTAVELTGKDTAKVQGNLTLLGITKPITLDVKLNKVGESPISKLKTAGFSATTIIKRSDFGIVYALPGVSDDVYVERLNDSGYHPSGTVPMGPEGSPDAAVDSRGRFSGISGLTVADASIMPTIPSVNTNLPTLMIGERVGEWAALGALGP